MTPKAMKADVRQVNGSQTDRARTAQYAVECRAVACQNRAAWSLSNQGRCRTTLTGGRRPQDFPSMGTRPL